MSYNSDFLIAAFIILTIVLWQFFNQKRPNDLNNRTFLHLAVLGILDVFFELISTYYIASGHSDFGMGAILSTTIFYLMQTLLPFVLVCYIRTFHKKEHIHPGEMFILGFPTLILLFLILSNQFTGNMFFFESQTGYVKGPLYMLMYYCALLHIAEATLIIIFRRKALGPATIKALFQILVLSAFGVIVQALYQPLLMTGFGLSLAVLTLFLTINNPHANTDSLTGLYDKPYFIRKTEEFLAEKKSFHVITITFYQLNQINRAAGTQSGDQFLKLISEQLQEICGLQVFRITGKRFLVLASSLQEYEYFLTEIKKLFQQNSGLNAETSDKLSSPAILCGILNAEKLNDGGSILEYAEYLESLAPRNGIVETVQDDQKTMSSFVYNKEIEQFLHTAIEEDLFEVYYQPVYSLDEKCFVSLEALSRLRHPTYGWISPDMFIQIAERNRLVDQISDLQFRRVCRFLKDHEDLMKQLHTVKFNLSPLDLIKNDCSRRFIRIIDEFGLPHSYFQFEITETVATEYNNILNQAVEEFSNAGILLCLDDFGSGYANFNTVMRLPFAAIKLDRSLLFHICSDVKAATFYQSIVAAFQRMGYLIISEGVETQEELDLLEQWGVNMIQGYYFSRPLAPIALLELLTEKTN